MLSSFIIRCIFRVDLHSKQTYIYGIRIEPETSREQFWNAISLLESMLSWCIWQSCWSCGSHWHPQECSSEIWVLNLISGLNLNFSLSLTGFVCTKLLHLLGCVGNSVCFSGKLLLCSFPFLFIFLLTRSPLALLFVKTCLLLWHGQD